MKFCIIFAGAIGCSKTPVANYLSYKLNLPILNNDSIRTEVLEDLKVFDQTEYAKRRDRRLKEIFKKGISFIYDASIDREYKQFSGMMKKNGYQYKIISFDLSETFLKQLYKIKKYHESAKRLKQLVKDHEDFLNNSGLKISAYITDNNFKNRLLMSYKAVK
jgi:regulator of PEP synthase PpsR (kinase-PPPase family)